jgi:hypothetical protein
MSDPLRAALEYLADPESWGGDPRSQEATLYGHHTPYELAREALAADAQAAPTQRSVMTSGTSRHEGGTGA